MASRFVLPFADVGNGISPSDGAKLFFFETGTSTAKDTFSDASGTTPNANPVIADSKGVFPDIFISGSYKVQLKDKNDVQTWESDHIVSFSTSDQASTVFATVSALTAASPDAGVTVSTQGYTTAGDGGGAIYLIQTSAQFGGTPDELGDHTLANGNIAVLQHNGVVHPAVYGCDSTGATDNTSNFQAALDSGALTFEVRKGTWKIADVQIPVDVSMVGAGGEIKFVLGTTPSGIDCLSRSKIKGVAFDISGADTLGTSAAIDIEGDDVQILNNTFDGKTAGPSAFKFNYAVRISDTLSNLRTKIRGNTFKNTYFGIIRQAGTTGDFSYSQIHGNSFNGVDKGDAIEINVGADVDVQIHDNVINDVSRDSVSSAGIAIGVAGDGGLGGAEGDEIRRLSIQGNSVDNCDRGIHVEGCNNFLIDSNVASNVNGATAEAGIQVFSSNDFTITGNTAKNCTIAGIAVQAESTDESSTGVVSSNIVIDCVKGINVDCDVANSSVSIGANTVRNSVSAGITAKGACDFSLSGNSVEDSVLGYSIDAQSASNKISLSGNISTNNTTERLLTSTTNTSFYSSGNSFIADMQPTITFDADDTTPDVRAGNEFQTQANTVATAITAFTGFKGQVITVRGGSATNASTIADSGNFRINGAITLTTHTMITLRNIDGTTWVEISRSIN